MTAVRGHLRSFLILTCFFLSSSFAPPLVLTYFFLYLHLLLTSSSIFTYFFIYLHLLLHLSSLTSSLRPRLPPVLMCSVPLLGLGLALALDWTSGAMCHPIYKPRSSLLCWPLFPRTFTCVRHSHVSCRCCRHIHLIRRPLLASVTTTLSCRHARRTRIQW